MNPNCNADGQPLAPYRARENIIKTIEHLIGLCRGLTCDGQLNDAEIAYLDTWLRNNSADVIEHPIGRLIYQRIEQVLSDGIVTDDERAELIEVLSSVTGGLQRDGGAGGLSISPAPALAGSVFFADKSFVITGKFIYGPRRSVEQAILDRAGIIHDGVTKKTNYVVVGTMGSRDWTNTSFGTKLEKVYKLQEAGAPVVILSEPDWSDAL